MKKFIKIISLIIIIVSLFTLTGCFDKNVKKITDNLNARNDKKISLGSWNENIYTNDFLNVKYTMSEGWTRHSDEEIANMMDIGTEYLNDDQKVYAKIAELTSVTYLMASDDSTGSNVILMSERQLTNKIKIETYINSLKNNLSKNETLSYEIGETNKVSVNNIEYTVLDAKASMNGVTVYQKYYIRKQDKYFISIVIT